MGIDQTIRVGAYAVVVSFPVTGSRKIVVCPGDCSLGVRFDGKFCPYCGNEGTRKVIPTQRNADLSDLLDLENERVFSPPVDLTDNEFVMCGNEHIHTAIDIGSRSGVFEIEYSAIHRCLNNFKNRYAPELKVLREKCYSVEVKFGMLVWES